MREEGSGQVPDTSSLSRLWASIGKVQGGLRSRSHFTVHPGSPPPDKHSDDQQHCQRPRRALLLHAPPSHRRRLCGSPPRAANLLSATPALSANPLFPVGPSRSKPALLLHSWRQPRSFDSNRELLHDRRNRKENQAIFACFFDYILSKSC